MNCYQTILGLAILCFSFACWTCWHELLLPIDLCCFAAAVSLSDRLLSLAAPEKYCYSAAVETALQKAVFGTGDC